MKTVVDRIVQYANRYKLTNAETGAVLGTFDFDEVTGTVQQVGTEIDAELFQSIADDLAARVKLSGGELKDTVVTFSDISGTAENVASGDTSATLWGKVKNWFSRLKALAFKDKISNADVDDDAGIAQSKISGLSDALAEKQPTITGAATSITNNNLTESRAVISDVNGKVAVSPVTETELGYLDGVTENIQTQIDKIEDGTTTVGEAEHAKKNDYNLGAYDTYVSNDDGTATITRKTGYVVINSENIAELKTNNNIRYVETNVSITDVNGTAWQRTVGKCSQPLTVAIGDTSSLSAGFKNAILIRYLIGSNVYNNGAIILQKENLETLQDYKNLCPLYIQYELATSYTEQVIENQPIHTIDQHGEQWLRDEWEKGLNLAPILDDGPYSLSAGNERWVVKNITQYTEPNKTYTISCEGVTFSNGLDAQIIRRDNDGHNIYSSFQNPVTFTITGVNVVEVRLGGNTLTASMSITPKIMLVEGDHAYPYQPYNGKIVHEKRLNNALKDYLPLTGGTIDGNLNVTDELQENGQRVYSPNNPQPLADSGVTAGNYGQPNDATPAAGDTFKIPYITVDAKGRITDASTKTITMPSGTSGQDGQDGAGIYTATVNSANPLQFFVFYYQTQPTPKIGDTFICDDLWDTSHDTNYGGNVYTIQSIVSSEAGGLIVTGVYDNLNLKGEDGQDGTNGTNGTNGADGTDGTDGLNMFYSSGSYVSYTQYITYSTLTIPDGYEIKVGDLILCANGNLFSVIATDSNNNRATVDYQSSLAGADGTNGKDASRYLHVVTFDALSVQYVSSATSVNGTSTSARLVISFYQSTATKLITGNIGNYNITNLKTYLKKYYTDFFAPELTVRMYDDDYSSNRMFGNPIIHYVTDGSNNDRIHLKLCGVMATNTIATNTPPCTVIADTDFAFVDYTVYDIDGKEIND